MWNTKEMNGRGKNEGGTLVFKCQVAGNEYLKKFTLQLVVVKVKNAPLRQRCFNTSGLWRVLSADLFACTKSYPDSINHHDNHNRFFLNKFIMLITSLWINLAQQQRFSGNCRRNCAERVQSFITKPFINVLIYLKSKRLIRCVLLAIN
jgi:hypothetical protein